MEPYQQSFTTPSPIQGAMQNSLRQRQMQMDMLNAVEQDYLGGQSIPVEKLQKLDQISRMVRGYGFAEQSSGGGIGAFAKGFANELSFGLLEGTGILDKPQTVAGAKAFSAGETTGLLSSLIGGGALLKSSVKAGGKLARLLGTSAAGEAAIAARNAEGATGLLSGGAKTLRNALTRARRPAAVAGTLGAVQGAADAMRDDYGNYNSLGEVAQGALTGAGTGAVIGGMLGGVGHRFASKTSGIEDEVAAAAAKADEVATAATKATKPTPKIIRDVADTDAADFYTPTLFD